MRESASNHEFNAFYQIHGPSFAGVDHFPTVSIMLDSRSARIVAVLIAFSSVAPFSSTCVHDRRSFHFTRFHGKLKHC
mgnify:CR=1 FL=1